jgi:hypothetical protein
MLGGSRVTVLGRPYTTPGANLLKMLEIFAKPGNLNKSADLPGKTRDCV